MASRAIAMRLMVAMAVASVALVSCTESENTGQRPSASVDDASLPDRAEREPPLEKWSRSCALCHVNGEGGAPRVGHAEEWAPRLDQGEEVILERIIEGYNNMPPLGYCMDCTRQDFLELTRYMAGDR